MDETITVPKYVGSPAMLVIAVIPFRHDPREFVAAVRHSSYPRERYGTVRTWCDAAGNWQCTAGHYDLTRDSAIRDMVFRAGWQGEPREDMT
jgi:hypothetical protein